MKEQDIYQIILLLFLLCTCAPLLAQYMAKVFEGRLGSIFQPLVLLEHRIYRLLKIDLTSEMSWRSYLTSLLCFNALGILLLFLIQIGQGFLPLNPSNLAGVSPLLALNTAISFVTNTNWQAYSGEATMSHLTQMLGLGSQNFLSAATGLAVAVALARGLSRKNETNLGNFWVDLTRSTLYILLPLSILFSILLVQQGVLQNFLPDLKIQTLVGGTQSLPMGPVASQIAIKQLGSNGGGFFGVNSAHPFENPTPFSNFIELFAILLIPVAIPLMFGRMIRQRSHGRALFATMSILFLVILSLSLFFEFSPHPILGPQGIMEGKEVRFGVMNSVLWSAATTATSNGSVNAMISSLSPLTGGLALLNILLGEVVFGGVGSGLYGMITFVIVTVFLAGLMVGRTPEYLGKRIESKEIKYSLIAIIAPCALILAGSAVAVLLPAGLSSLAHKGPHGLSEVLYAFASAGGNNGSAFAGLSANTPFYNLALGFSMLIGRFLVIIPVIAIAGSLASKNTVPPSLGTFPTDNALFVFLLIGVILIVGALTFFPVFALGPFIEHLLMILQITF